jgi:hypothetical protein
VEVALPIRRLDHEVEHGTIVPQVIPTAEIVAADVGLDPGDACRVAAERGLAWASAAGAISATVRSL